MTPELDQKYNKLEDIVLTLNRIKNFSIQCMLELFPEYLREFFNTLPDEIHALLWVSVSFEIEGEFSHFTSCIDWREPDYILDKEGNKLDEIPSDYYDALQTYFMELIKDSLISSDNNVLTLYRDGSWKEYHDPKYY